MIEEERIKYLNTRPTKNREYVLYWMQSSHRTEYNHALEYAILRANKVSKPIIVFFGVTNKYPEANARHYHFMLEGIKDVLSSLEEKGIKMVIRDSSPDIGAKELSGKACLVVTDRGYLRVQRKWSKNVAESVDCPLVQVESNAIVPVEVASFKEEYSAATFRPKIGKSLKQYLVPLVDNDPRVSSLDIELDSFNIEDVEKSVAQLDVDDSVERVRSFRGGNREAKAHLDSFLKEKLDSYDQLRNDPPKNNVSNMSPYLHYGQISPLYIALQVLETVSSGKDAYLEELITRRELSVNFVHYSRDYDSFSGLPEWAKRTLREHGKDAREYIYDLGELESAETHDPYWNASQKEMMIKGKMHGYMRMYWGKKILEWSKTPEEAFITALYLNNKYELDGRDPNGYTGVAWCFGKHDRPWKERNVFGKVRYMNANGLKRKFDIDKYVENVDRLVA